MLIHAAFAVARDSGSAAFDEADPHIIDPDQFLSRQPTSCTSLLFIEDCILSCKFTL
ncbi:MAG TPA: hypothetical protein VKV39_10405 [Candidatus Sulfotelmatobacter sp.]|nr:hypothetical protein [Candidatus Sulfotelmatobacter sp.]